MPRFSFTIRLIRLDGTRIACAKPLMLISSSFMSSSRILPGWIGGSFSTLVVVRDFDIGWTLRSPFEADFILIIDPDAELALAFAAQRFPSVPAKRPQIFQGCRGVKPD